MRSALDGAPARRRHWCSEGHCGNLANVAGFRLHRRATSAREAPNR
ncbi:CGNR zinc finger domain-containing protein [Streptomyces sp. NPDC058914]